MHEDHIGDVAPGGDGLFGLASLTEEVTQGARECVQVLTLRSTQGLYPFSTSEACRPFSRASRSATSSHTPA